MDPLTEEIKAKLNELLGQACQPLLLKFKAAQYPWHLLDILEKEQAPFLKGNHGKIHEFAVIEGEVFISDGAVIRPFTYIRGPAFIGPNADIGPHTFIRPSTIIGADCHVRTSHVKNSIVLSRSKVPHYSYVGESIISEDCNFGAGSHTADLRLDEKTVKVKIGNEFYDTHRRKFGCILEPGVKLACATILNPGAYVRKGARLLGSRDYKGYVEGLGITEKTHNPRSLTTEVSFSSAKRNS